VIPRAISGKVKELATKFPVISLTGPRQSGKTTLIKHLFPEYTYTNLEDPDIRNFARQSPKEFINQSVQGLIIDEAQYEPDIFSYIQLHVDQNQQPGKIILCGSQHFLMMERISQSLAGRVGLLHLLPLSVQELTDSGFHRKDAVDYIFNGFYPRIFSANIHPEDFYPSYIQTYIERDARQIINITDLDAFHSFIRLCAGRTGNLFNQSELGSLIGVDQKTIARWLTIIKAGFQVFTLPPYFKNFEKRILKTPKLYFWDTGIACSLLGIRNAEQLNTHYARGALFENFIIVETLKQFYNAGRQPHAYFWSDRRLTEIDLLMDEGTRLYPIEIKASQRISEDFFNGIKSFNALSENDPGLSYLIYGGNSSYTHPNGMNVRGWLNIPDFNQML